MLGASCRPQGRAPVVVAADPRLRGHLLRALGHEMGAVQQYLAQASLAEMWELDDYARRFRRDGVDELAHVERLIHRMLLLGITPNSGSIAPVRQGRSVKEMLLIDRALEIEAIHAYDDAARYCARIGDRATEGLFAGLLREELEHLESIDEALAGSELP